MGVLGMAGSARLSLDFPVSICDDAGVVVLVEEDPFVELRRIARRPSQRGCFTSAQASAAGLSRARLSRLVQRGTVVREAPRVYRFTVAAALDWKDRLAVELLSTGGIACGLSAAALCGLAEPPDRPDVLMPRGSRGAVPGRRTTREPGSSHMESVPGAR